MFVDLTLSLARNSSTKQSEQLIGHLGTHFDVMNKVFPLEYVELKGCLFSVTGKDEIDIEDIDISKIKEKDFVLFHTGRIEKYPYGSKEYGGDHPQLSNELIDLLISKKVSLIGIDAQGIRRHNEHTPADQKCADNNIFVIENLCNLDKLNGYENITVLTMPVNFTGYSGLPCRVIAKIQKQKRAE